jgi:ribose-phosphate pyrophosphokinase
MKGTEEFARQVAGHLEHPLAHHVEEPWDDGEFYVRSDVNVRSCDCFVIQSLYADEHQGVSEKTMRLLYFVGSLFDASASRVTAVVPYLAWSRQDRKNQSRAPVYTKYLAMMLTRVHANRLLTMDVHNISALHNSHQDMQTDHLEAKILLADAIAREVRESGVRPEQLRILAPDAGGMKRAERARDAIAHRLDDSFIDLVTIDKRRQGRVVKAQRLTGDVAGKKVIAIDDVISTGSSMRQAQEIVENNGGELWAVAATHGLFVGRANEHLSSVRRIFVTDTVRPWRLNEANRARVCLVDTTQMFAQAIRRTYEAGGSISELLETP